MNNQTEKPTELFLMVEAGVRFWEDAYINGIQDEEDNPAIPCKISNMWCPLIEMTTGKIKNWKPGINADIHYKVCDAGEYWIVRADGTKAFKWNDHYVPRFLSIESNGWGDYIIMKISSEGVIQNWKPPAINNEEWTELA